MNNKRIYELLKIIKSKVIQEKITYIDPNYNGPNMPSYCTALPIEEYKYEVKDPLYEAVQYLLEEDIKRKEQETKE